MDWKKRPSANVYTLQSSAMQLLKQYSVFKEVQH